MKQYYLFSENKLKYVEIKGFKFKFLFFIVMISLIFSATFFTGFVYLNKSVDVTALEAEKKELTASIQEMLIKYEALDKKLDYAAEDADELRLKVNLEPYTAEDRNFGTGGSAFKIISAANGALGSSLASEINNYVEKIDSRVEFERKNLAEIKQAATFNKEFFRHVPALRPVSSPYGDLFGMRYHPILKYRRMHNGLDFRSMTGTQVYAPGDGKVVFAGRKGGYGLTVEIDHGFGYRTLYGHLYRTKVKRGQKVKRGDLIALTGNSGSLTTGPHLHYEVIHNGVGQDPFNFIYDDLEPEQYNELAKK